VSAHGVPVYHYVFDFKSFGALDRWFHIGASHIFEIPFVFRNHIKQLSNVFECLITDCSKKWWQMADLTSCTWASFIKCQKPQCPSDPPPNCGEAYSEPGLQQWTPFTPNNRNYLLLDTQPTMKRILKEAPVNNEFAGDDKCDFWAQANFQWHDPSAFFKREQHSIADSLANVVESIVV
jgi:carboxylesterase type B